MEDPERVTRRRVLKLIGLGVASAALGGLHLWQSREIPEPAIVIDPGHGGYDPGVVANGVREADVALVISLALRDMLSARGYPVIMTRERDEHLHTTKRRDLMARTDLTTRNCSLFISIHANGIDEPSVHGVETFIFGNPEDAHSEANARRENGGEEPSQGWALLQRSSTSSSNRLELSRVASEYVQRSLVRTTGARDRGVRRGRFYVIREANAPAMLIETGFLTNAAEAQRLSRHDYQILLAQAIADGVSHFFAHQAEQAEQAL